MAQITSLNLLDVKRFESPEILKKLALSSRRLAELKPTFRTPAIRN